MRIARIMLRVSDMERSIAFWSVKVGLEVQYAAGEFAFLDGGGVQLALNRVQDLPPDETMTEIVFEVDDVTAAYDHLGERGVDFEVQLRSVTSDGDRDLLAAHFYDPDGHVASITGWVTSA